MRSRILFTPFALALLVLSAPTVQAQVVDQSQLTGGPAYEPYSSYQGQTFKPTASTVAGGGFYIRNFGNPQALTMNIFLWSAVPSTNGATLLASGSATQTTGWPDEPMWFDAFWSPVTVTPGNTYFLGIHSINPSGGVPYIFAAGGNAYADGSYWYSYSQNPTDNYLDFGASDDAVFREFSEGPTESAAPEPATLALLATGLAGLGLISRRRRR